mmetsp:Transcript_13310/g.49779  ORF Transcript_13310/g.49779 Transcript_13310/m.49779 type:complete len:300 (-) Transcript_13310:1-900(-)
MVMPIFAVFLSCLVASRARVSVSFESGSGFAISAGGRANGASSSSVMSNTSDSLVSSLSPPLGNDRAPDFGSLTKPRASNKPSSKFRKFSSGTPATDTASPESIDCKMFRKSARTSGNFAKICFVRSIALRPAVSSSSGVRLFCTDGRWAASPLDSPSDSASEEPEPDPELEEESLDDDDRSFDFVAFLLFLRLLCFFSLLSRLRFLPFPSFLAFLLSLRFAFFLSRLRFFAPFPFREPPSRVSAASATRRVSLWCSKYTRFSSAMFESAEPSCGWFAVMPRPPRASHWQPPLMNDSLL